MTLLALLVSTDDSASEILSRVLTASGIGVERCSDLAEAIERLQRQKFDALIIDFEDAKAAAEIFEGGRRLNSGTNPITVALVAVRARTREILSSGAHFVLYKPLSDESAAAGLRAVIALLTRERRRAFRIPVQAAVELSLPNTCKLEGILLDLSETGLDVLTAEPQVPGALLNLRFQLPGSTLEMNAQGQVVWAKPNGQSGVRFIEMEKSAKAQLKEWLQAAASANSAGPEETVPHCKLTDLSLGGCYLETDSPFPEHALVDLCLRSGDMEVHTEGMVRVVHPAYGMGVEFPSRTAEQRAQVGNLISLLQSGPQSTPELSVSPQSLKADVSQFEPDSDASGEGNDGEMEDPLLDLLRLGTTMQQDDFLHALRQQRSGESVAQ
ncbi:MAG: PilZ domain-containing protein [Candidatus Sulfotelmatobacter sp.]|jgi:DNA-binding response OmpR family regulator